jgi:hypothetical protein
MKPPHIATGTEKFTHYSYLSCPIGVKREPTGLFDLEAASIETRRRLIHQLNVNGELLSLLPFPEIKNMRQLRGALQWLHDNN